jgi:hypothetical protein
VIRGLPQIPFIWGVSNVRENARLWFPGDSFVAIAPVLEGVPGLFQASAELGLGLFTGKCV